MSVKTDSKKPMGILYEPAVSWDLHEIQMDRRLSLAYRPSYRLERTENNLSPAIYKIDTSDK